MEEELKNVQFDINRGIEPQEEEFEKLEIPEVVEPLEEEPFEVTLSEITEPLEPKVEETKKIENSQVTTAKDISNTIEQLLFKNLAQSANKYKQKQTKLQEYRLTEEQIRFAEFIMLDGVVCKDRDNLSKVKGDLDKINMTEHSVIIGINGHILYTTVGQVVKGEKPKLRLQKEKHYRT